MQIIRIKIINGQMKAPQEEVFDWDITCLSPSKYPEGVMGIPTNKIAPKIGSKNVDRIASDQ